MLRKPLAIAALLVLLASPAFAVQEVVTWVPPDSTKPGFIAATGVRVDIGPTPTTLVKGPLLAPTANTTTITSGLTLGVVNCTQINYVNGFGDNPMFAAPVCSPAGGLATPGSNATIIYTP